MHKNDIITRILNKNGYSIYSFYDLLTAKNKGADQTIEYIVYSQM